jgi:transposase-like protein
MAKEKRKKAKQIYRYSICFKEKVVQGLSSGSNINKVCLRYGIKRGSTVQRWIKKFGRQELLNEIVYVKMKGEKNELKRLQSENQRLKIAIGELLLEKLSLAQKLSVSRNENDELKRELVRLCISTSMTALISPARQYGFVEERVFFTDARKVLAKKLGFYTRIAMRIVDNKKRGHC